MGNKKCSFPLITLFNVKNNNIKTREHAPLKRVGVKRVLIDCCSWECKIGCVTVGMAVYSFVCRNGNPYSCVIQGTYLQYCKDREQFENSQQSILVLNTF